MKLKKINRERVRRSEGSCGFKPAPMDIAPPARGRKRYRDSSHVGNSLALSTKVKASRKSRRSRALSINEDAA